MKRVLIIFLLSFSVCAIAQVSVPTIELITVAGTNTYTATVPIAPGSASAIPGYKKMFKFTNANSGASTFNLSWSVSGGGTWGAITLRKSDGTALSSGDIPAGSVWWLVHDGTASQWRLTGGSGSAFALTPGSGTTVGADLTSVDLGGNQSGDVYINTATNSFSVYPQTAGGDISIGGDINESDGDRADNVAVAASDNIGLNTSSNGVNINETTGSTFRGTTLFPNSGFRIRNPATTFNYTFVGSAIAANRNITLPLLSNNDTFTFNAASQTLTNKTFGNGTNFSLSPTISAGVKFAFFPSATAAGFNWGQITSDPSAPPDGDTWYRSDTDIYKGRSNGVTRDFITDSDTQTLTNKSLSGSSNNFTNIPISTAISGLGTGVSTALGVNVGSAGSVVVNGGAGGTPSSINLSGGTGLPLTTGVTGLLPYANFSNGVGLSVVGRSANTSGVQADIAAGADNNILRRSGTSIGFGSINLASSGAVGSTVLPVANGGTGITSLGTGVATWLGTPSWTNFNSAITGTAPFWNVTGTTTLTGTVLIAQGGFNTTFQGNGRVTFAPSGSGSAGLNFGVLNGSPLTYINADAWYNDSPHGFYGRRNGVSLAFLMGSDAWLTASGGSATATNTWNFTTFPWIINSSVTTGTGATAGIQYVANSLTTGNGFDASTSSLSSGVLIKAVSTSTAINHTAGTNSVGWFETSGTNANSARTAIALSGKATNTGTTSLNIGVYGAASGASTNYAGYFTGGIIETSGMISSGVGGSGGFGSFRAWDQGANIWTFGRDQVTTGNFVISSGGAGNRYFNITTAGNFSFGTDNTTPLSKVYILQAALSSAWLPTLRADPGAHTGQLTTVEYPNFVFETATQTGASGTTPIQRNAWIKGITYAGTSGTRTATSAYGLYVEPYLLGSNAALTNNFALGLAGNLSLATVGSKISIKEGSGGSSGQATLVAGTLAITVTGTTTSTRCFTSLVAANTTALTTDYQCACTANTVTLRANVAAGTINVADISTLNYILIEPAP